MKVKEVIVVEGRDDTAKLHQSVDADTIETNGSAVDKGVIEQVRHAKDKRGVIIFTDPDYPGKRIRHIIDQAVPGCKHAFLPNELAYDQHSKKSSLGVEHASKEAIQDALSNVYSLAKEQHTDITREDLVISGLIGSTKASSRRKRLSRILKIGHTNGKQLLKRLTMFRITKEQFNDAVQQVIQEENHSG